MNINLRKPAGVSAVKLKIDKGYLDYLIPQIYWSNQWGENADVTMFTDRLDQFCL